jgi:hypothetical protein
MARKTMKVDFKQEEKDYAKALKKLKMFAKECDKTFNEDPAEENMIALF